MATEQTLTIPASAFVERPFGLQTTIASPGWLLPFGGYLPLDSGFVPGGSSLGRWLGGLYEIHDESNPDHGINMYIASSLSDAFSGFGGGDDLSAAFEAGGGIGLSQGDHSVMFALAGADTTEPYIWSPTNQADYQTFLAAIDTSQDVDFFITDTLVSVTEIQGRAATAEGTPVRARVVVIEGTVVRGRAATAEGTPARARVVVQGPDAVVVRGRAATAEGTPARARVVVQGPAAVVVRGRAAIAEGAPARARVVTVVIQPAPDQDRVWPARIQWSSRWDEEFRFRTEIIRSRNGKEQRIAQRNRPRLTYEFESYLDPIAFRRTIPLMAENQGSPIQVPYPLDIAKLSFDVAPGDTSVQVEEMPAWAATGIFVILEGRPGRELVEVRASAGRTIIFTSLLTNAFSAGDRMFRVVEGHMQRAVRLRALTSRAGLARMRLEEDILTAHHRTFPAAYPQLDGLDYFTFGPQWAAGTPVSFEQPFEEIDFNRGVRDRVFPIDYTTRLTRLRYVVREPDHLISALGLFYRSKGRQKDFYASGYLDELRPVATVAPGGDTLEFERPLYEAYKDSDTYKRLAIRTGGVATLHEIDDWNISQAGRAIMEVTPALANGLVPDNVQSMSWVVRSRFETDLFSLDWLTDRTATTTIVLRTLEDTP